MVGRLLQIARRPISAAEAAGGERKPKYAELIPDGTKYGVTAEKIEMLRIFLI